MAVLGLRAWSPEALERRVAAVEATGLGEGWPTATAAAAPCYRFRDPDGHLLRALLRRASATSRPSTCGRR